MKSTPEGGASARSLATTYGISVDFSSSPYLDVSVQAVPLLLLERAPDKREVGGSIPLEPTSSLNASLSR